MFLARRRDFDDSRTLRRNLFVFLEENISTFKPLPMFVFDVHNTTVFHDENDVKTIDPEVFQFIRSNCKRYNFLFLSYDGNDERIRENEKFLNSSCEEFKDIPKIFCKLRRKGELLKTIEKFFERRKKKSLIFFVDDNLKNMKDSKGRVRNLIPFMYSKHSSHSDEFNDFKMMNELFKENNIDIQL